MANAVWPPSLPQDFFIGVTHQRRAAFAQFTVDAGPAKRRRIAGNVSRDVRVPMTFTETQMADFDDFYVATLFDGALPFDWIHPITGLPATYRFNSYPSFGISISSLGQLHQSTLDLELVATVDLA